MPHPNAHNVCHAANTPPQRMGGISNGMWPNKCMFLCQKEPCLNILMDSPEGEYSKSCKCYQGWLSTLCCWEAADQPMINRGKDDDDDTYFALVISRTFYAFTLPSSIGIIPIAASPAIRCWIVGLEGTFKKEKQYTNNVKHIRA